MRDASSFSDNYRIEVSGWGLNDVFFVETTNLHWTEGGDKKLRLHHALPEGAVAFVRLVSPEPSYTSVPVAYRVEGVQPMNSLGLCEMRLSELRPRFTARARRELASSSTRHSSKSYGPKENSLQPDREEALHEA
jgi:hypothetical protein